MSDERKGSFSSETHERVKTKVDAAGGDTSYAGRQKIKDTGKLHPLVDPAEFDLIRRSLPRYANNQPKGVWKIPNGIPMLSESRLDTTGSMEKNIKLMFDSLPKFYDLVAGKNQPVLGRYDPQIINSIFGDIQDEFILARSQAEMDEKISEQLTLMVPEGAGGDEAEDPEYGLFAGAYLTDAFIHKYGLKHYDFTVTDTNSHGRIDVKNLIRVFSEKVFEKVKENRQLTLKKTDLPGTAEIVKELKKHAHAFMILIDGPHSYWKEFYGDEYIVELETAQYLAYAQATIIGLTEGVFDLTDVPEYLKSNGLNMTEAKKIQRAVANIPIGAQARFENFAKIPEKGSIFANKHDLWPIIGKPEEKKPEAKTWM
jgi:hypothetical protein